LKTEIEEMKIALEIMAASNKTCDDKYNHELDKHQEQLNCHGEQIRGLDHNTTTLELLEDKHYQLADDVAVSACDWCGPEMRGFLVQSWFACFYASRLVG